MCNDHLIVNCFLSLGLSFGPVPILRNLNSKTFFLFILFLFRIVFSSCLNSYPTNVIWHSLCAYTTSTQPNTFWEEININKLRHLRAGSFAISIEQIKWRLSYLRFEKNVCIFVKIRIENYLLTSTSNRIVGFCLKSTFIRTKNKKSREKIRKKHRKKRTDQSMCKCTQAKERPKAYEKIERETH